SEDDVVVIMLPDSGFRYLSKTYNDEWMRRHGFSEEKPDLTVEEVLRGRRASTEVVSVSADETLGTAIQRMAEFGISQLPVLEDGAIVGSLTETLILNHRSQNPASREQAVREVMQAAFPIVPRSLHLDHLSAYLEQGAGAVLVEMEAGEHYTIITKSDLISAL